MKLKKAAKIGLKVTQKKKKKRSTEENVLLLKKYICFWEGRKRNDDLEYVFPARCDTKSRAWAAEKFAVDARDGWEVQVPGCPVLSVTECWNLVSVMGSFGGSGLPGTVTIYRSGWEEESTQGAMGESEAGWMENRRGLMGSRPAQTSRACCDSETSPSLLETTASLTLLQALCSKGTATFVTPNAWPYAAQQYSLSREDHQLPL